MMSEAAEPLGEIDLSKVAEVRDGDEFLRMWKAGGGGGVLCFIRPHALAPDPFTFGMAAVDAIHHAARAWAQAAGVSEEEALARVYEGFDAERARATTDITQVERELHQAAI